MVEHALRGRADIAGCFGSLTEARGLILVFRTAGKTGCTTNTSSNFERETAKWLRSFQLRARMSPESGRESKVSERNARRNAP